METWWGSLDPFMQTLWGIAIFASLVFIIQSVMTFVGMDSNTDFDASFEGDMSVDGGGESTPFQLFTFRNLINFLLGFSWTAIAVRASTESTATILIASVIVGVLLVAAVMFLFKWMSGMQQSGTIDMNEAVGSKGSVYLTVPAHRSGEGKVQITVRGAIREYDAAQAVPLVLGVFECALHTGGQRLPSFVQVVVCLFVFGTDQIQTGLQAGLV